MSSSRVPFIPLALLLLSLTPLRASAVVTVYFSPDQVATLVNSGVTSDEITCNGYSFTYTRDKLFTGGTGTVIGRPVRVTWPTGIEAQYVTTGPNPSKAQITVKRVDGAVFALTSFTAKLLANAGAGRAIEIVPLLGGQELLNDPLYFDVTGYAGNSFSYDTTPNPWGCTAPLTGYDEYRIGLTLDYALTALTLTDDSAPLGVEPGPAAARTSGLSLSPNPAGGPVRIVDALGVAAAHGRLAVYAATGARVRTLTCDGSGLATWNLDDENGRAVAAGLYFVRREGTTRAGDVRRVVVMR
ncbi:MAG: hypothetical protein HZA61_06455 [Candidatus Eisenbacteria bacterium]|uniref:T9SS type A sorting domain-containing protein n=1 Tax=Eiseniibacteriota bacterium TaxID=2212470 RepID=A0A933SCD6_UNCEI|nr:hypothetical protein [Candidatus Eisenbacteria bacterium]